MERRYGLCAAENILGDEKYMVRDEMYTVGDDEKLAGLAEGHASRVNISKR